MVDAAYGRGRLGHARVTVLTVIGKEMGAALAEFEATHEIANGYYTDESRVETMGRLSQTPFVIAQCDDRNNQHSQSRTREVIEAWHPEFVLLCGIGGGVARDVGEGEWEGPQLGDVVLPKVVHAGDYGKSTEQKPWLPRYEALVHPASDVEQHVTGVVRALDDFPMSTERPEGADAESPKVSSGEVISQNSVAGNPKDERQQRIVRHFDKANVIDMESEGVGISLHKNLSDVPFRFRPRWYCIRSISDHYTDSPEIAEILPDNNETRALWKGYAAEAASRVAHQLARRLCQEERQAFRDDQGGPAW